MSSSPAPRRFRFDGWTPARRAAFLEVFMAGANVTRAAAAVEMSVASLNALKRRDAGFRAAFQAACAERDVRRGVDLTLRPKPPQEGRRRNFANFDNLLTAGFRPFEARMAARHGRGGRP